MCTESYCDWDKECKSVLVSKTDTKMLQIKLSCDSDGFVTVLPINTARLGPKLLIFGRHMTNTGSSKASLLPTHQMLLLAFNSHLT